MKRPFQYHFLVQKYLVTQFQTEKDTLYKIKTLYNVETESIQMEDTVLPMWCDGSHLVGQTAGLPPPDRAAVTLRRTTSIA
jgi:hypothetical protein